MIILLSVLKMMLIKLFIKKKSYYKQLIKGILSYNPTSSEVERLFSNMSLLTVRRQRYRLISDTVKKAVSMIKYHNK